MTQTVPLNKLVISPRNVRKTNAEEDVPGLADSIASKGLLQNLVVSPAEDGKLYEVDAGGRRLLALQLLADRKHLAKNWPVPVHVIARDCATEASLAENLQKIAMNPADEVEAFAAIVAGYEANGMASEAEQVANCARRFGVTERHVRQRLALAELAPDILDALREGRIAIAAATAYASHPDPQVQLKVFKAHEKRTGTFGRHDPRTIRDELQGKIYTADHRLARYVGIDAYRGAGGRIAIDLFFDEAEREILLDTRLLEKLATEKAECEAQLRAQAFGWLDALVRPLTGFSYNPPPAPDGYCLSWAGPADKAARATSIALYALDDAGELKIETNCYLKDEQLAATETGETAQRAETKEERAARRRFEDIRYSAARLAAPKTAGTPLEGRAFWPLDQFQFLEPYYVEQDTVTVALLVRIPVADVDAHLDEAERRYELAQQELREEQEALAAQGDPDEGTPDEDQTSREDEGGDDDTNFNDAARAEPEHA